MSVARKQSGLVGGIYEFDDASGTLLASRIPYEGSVDLYDGTVVIVRPNQCAILVYKGQITDVLTPGTHTLKTENVPVLTRLANWKLGLQSPLRCELVFLCGQSFVARRWGTAQPVLSSFEGMGQVAIRAYGNYTVHVADPELFFQKLFGSRKSMSITDIEDFVQGQIMEHLPNALAQCRKLDRLGQLQQEVSKDLEARLADHIGAFGLEVSDIQVISLLPPKEVIEAMDAKAAISLIGNQREYLLYKAAKSLDGGAGESGQDPLQMMVGLMLGKGLMGADYHDREAKVPAAMVGDAFCSGCGMSVSSEYHFCPRCGKGIKR